MLHSSTHSSVRAHTAPFEHTTTHSSVRAHHHTQLCSSTRTIMFRHTYAKLVQAHTALAALLASPTGHSATAAALLLHAAAALCYLTNSFASLSLVGDVIVAAALGLTDLPAQLSMVWSLSQRWVSCRSMAPAHGMSDAVSATNRSPPSGRDFYFQAAILSCSGP
jgi:hypothetical protein